MLIKRGKTWHCRFMFQGTLYQRSLHTRRRDEAIKFEGAFRTSLVKGELGLPNGSRVPTLPEFEQQLLPHLSKNVAPRTFQFYTHYLNALKNFPPMGGCQMHRIDEALIEKFIQFRLKQDGGRSVMTVNHSLRTLRRALILARKWKVIRDVPEIKLLPGEHERDYVLNDAELARMVDYIGKAYPTSLMRFLLPFLVDTGLRITEACRLEREHIEKTTAPWSIRIVKGKTKYAKRDIPLTARAASCLQAALEHSRSEYVWTTKGGLKALGRHYPSQQFRVIRDAIGLPSDCVLHSTRHTFCTRLGTAGADAFTIQKLAGHSSITVSQRYVHSGMEAKRSAIAMLDVLNLPQNVASGATITPGATIIEV
jgi:integrase